MEEVKRDDEAMYRFLTCEDRLTEKDIEEMGYSVDEVREKKDEDKK